MKRGTSLQRIYTRHSGELLAFAARMETTKPRILVVEDEAAIRDGLADVLVYHGFRVEPSVTAATGCRRR